MKKDEHFNQIVEENSERIKRICRYYNADHDDQMDMYQEILVNIWKSLDNFRGDAAMSTWIYRIAVNTSIQFTRKSIREMKLVVHADAGNLNNVLDDENLYQKFLQEKQFDLLENEINQLSVIDKALISLMLEGVSVAEMADIIGITVPNVKTKIHRIKAYLKEQLKNYSHE